MTANEVNKTRKVRTYCLVASPLSFSFSSFDLVLKFDSTSKLIGMGDLQEITFDVVDDEGLEVQLTGKKLMS